MDIKQTVQSKLNLLYKFILKRQSLQKVTLFNIAERIKNLHCEFLKKETDGATQFLINDLVKRFDKEYHKSIARMLLDNQSNYIKIMNPDNISQDSYIKLAAGVIERILVLNDIVSIQPAQSGFTGRGFRLIYEGNAIKINTPIFPIESHKLNSVWDPISFIEQPSTVFNCEKYSEVLTELLCDLVSSQLINQILSDIIELAYKPPPVELTRSSNMKVNSDDLAHILMKITSASRNIASSSNRGPGNFIITDFDGLHWLTQACINTNTRFAPHSQTNTSNPSLMLEGSILNVHGKVLYQVYSSLLLTTLNDELKYLIGYQSNEKSIDTGYIFAPHILLSLQETNICATTFEPQLNLESRYGKYMDTMSNSNSNSSNYYSLLTFKTNNNTEQT
ncbi:MAG: hypothetical protein ACXW2E_01740 [Nitrososphaeraceae archaeon]